MNVCPSTPVTACHLLLRPPAVMEYQVQINSIKAKLQETRARKKQQEELIMKVENQALKVSSAHMGTRSVRTLVQSAVFIVRVAVKRPPVSDWHRVKGAFLSERPSGHDARDTRANL